MDKNKTIGVFFGSRSPEHDVSIITAQLIISELKKMSYRVEAIYIDGAGKWFIDESLTRLKTFTDASARETISHSKPFVLDLQASVGKLVFRQQGIRAKVVTIDVAFPAFHGRYGEDGTIQGLFELFGVPYIGCGVAASAITMDKALTKLFYQSVGIPTTKFLRQHFYQWEADRHGVMAEAIKTLTFPIFIKPARLGSSIGISKVKNSDELERAYEVAFHYDHEVIVEQGIDKVKDITCCVVGHNTLITSLIQESVFDSDLLSYEDKYLKDGGAQLGNAEKSIIIPANISSETATEVQKLSKDVFQLLGCSGIARVDFLYDISNNGLYVNEVNTMPGTLYHHLWKASGMPVSELIENLLAYALERDRDEKRVSTQFSSNLLKMAGSIKLQIDHRD